MGAGDEQTSYAHIKEFEAEAKYQPNPRVFTTASYSCLHTPFKLAIYNLTDRRNLVNDFPYDGNDFLTVSTPRSYSLSVKYKFN